MSATDTLQNGGLIFSMYKSNKVLIHSNMEAGRAKRNVTEIINPTIANAMHDLHLKSIKTDSCGNKTFIFSCHQDPQILLISIKGGDADCIEAFDDFKKLDNEFYYKGTF